MIEWLILSILLASSIISLIIYTLSVLPVTLGEKYGKDYFKRCATFRRISLVFWILMMACYLAYFFIPIPITIPLFLDYQISFFTGIIMLVVGIGITIKGEMDVGEETAGPYKKTDLVTTGTYQYFRHPQTIGEIIALFGLTFILGSFFLILISLIAIPGFAIVIYFEEKDLVKRFGEKYKEYQKRVGIFFPKRKN